MRCELGSWDELWQVFQRIDVFEGKKSLYFIHNSNLIAIFSYGRGFHASDG